MTGPSSRGDPPERQRPGTKARAEVSFGGDGTKIPHSSRECKGWRRA